MDEQRYTVKLIDGDYAHLIDEAGNETLVARALLPLEIDEGSVLIYEQYEYRLVQE